MYCYRDRTFCGSVNCKNACGCKITKEQKEDADRMNMPISYTEFCDENGNEIQE
jgi:hypothetical protein